MGHGFERCKKLTIMEIKVDYELVLRNTADAAHTNSIEFYLESLLICSAKVYYLLYFKRFLIKYWFLKSDLFSI